MMRSAKQWIRWAAPVLTRCKRSLLVLVLGLFSTAHLLAAAPAEDHFTEVCFTSANWSSAAGADLNATIESGESSISMDVVLRDATHSPQTGVKAIVSTAVKMSGLRCLTEPGTTGPPSTHNNTSAAA